MLHSLKRFLRLDFQLSQRSNVTGINYIKNKKMIYIYRLFKENKRYLTNKPIAVKIYQDEGLFFAENENLNVCGTGETSQEALVDLYLHILHFYKYYREIDEERLIGDAIRLKKLYHDLLIEEK